MVKKGVAQTDEARKDEWMQAHAEWLMRPLDGEPYRPLAARQAQQARFIRTAFVGADVYPSSDLADPANDWYVDRARRKLALLARHHLDRADVVALFLAAEVLWMFNRLPGLFEVIRAMEAPGTAAPKA